MKQQRTIYFNDARHYYLFVFEPPMTLEDACRPINECSNTSIDTFIYGSMILSDPGIIRPKTQSKL